MKPFKTTVPTQSITNGDEALVFGPAGSRYLGNFHKSLPRRSDGSGEVDPVAYQSFAFDADHGGDFETVARVPGATKLNNPQAGRATEMLGPNPSNIHMPPAPGVLSTSTAAEMVELYWMANLRDVTLDTLKGSVTANAIADIASAYSTALSTDTSPGALKLGIDLPADAAGNALEIVEGTLFRVGLTDEQHGPLVSQFFLHDINYGAQLIQQTQVPYAQNKDYLLTFADWLLAQEKGVDMDGNAYGDCNNFSAPTGPSYYETDRRRIATMRDIARFVNRDALHQAYFNAALMLLNWNCPADMGNPYNLYSRQAGFGTLGGPNLLSLVSEVASRALKVVWRQKWLHRRLRPEVYGGLLHQQKIGEAAGPLAYGLPDAIFNQSTDLTTFLTTNAYFLPIAYTAGSPPHPSYGAGHATVAGACVTILKAWFDESVKMVDLFAKFNASKKKDPTPYFPLPTGAPAFQLDVWEPGTVTTGQLPAYAGEDRTDMTVRGELNKIAANVAMGRSMGGVHFRSDNTRSLRLGEQIATIVLSRIMPNYAEKPSMSYTNFDGNTVTIDATGKVTVPQDAGLEAFYTRPF